MYVLLDSMGTRKDYFKEKYGLTLEQFIYQTSRIDDEKEAEIRIIENQ